MNQSEELPHGVLNQYSSDFFNEAFDLLQSESPAGQFVDLLPDEFGLTSLDSSEPLQFVDTATNMQPLQSAETVFDSQLSNSDPDLFT